MISIKTRWGLVLRVVAVVLCLATLPHQAQAASRVYWASTLSMLANISKVDAVTGDANTTPLATGDTSIVIATDRTYHYQYSSTSTATEASPSVVAPYDSSGTGRWLLSGSDATPTNVALADNASATCNAGEFRLYTVAGVWKKCANGTESNLSGSGSADLTTPGPIGSTTPSTGAFTLLTAASFDIAAPAAGETSELALAENPANGTNVVSLKAPASIASDVTLTLPNAYGATGQVLATTNGTGALAFVTLAPVLIPSTATTPCTAGNWSYDGGYIYVCVAGNTWGRAALTTW